MRIPYIAAATCVAQPSVYAAHFPDLDDALIDLQR